MHVVTPIQSVHARLAWEYISLMESCNDWETNIESVKRENLIAFCKLQIERIMAWEMPDDKVGRWLWFVQWSLAVLGVIDVDEERESSRPMFHSAYNQSWINIPETKEIKKK